MRIIYEFKTGADPENPNEQLPGNTINDDRIYGYRIWTIITSGQAYNEAHYTKNINSNKLTLTLPGQEFSNGDIVCLETL